MNKIRISPLFLSDAEKIDHAVFLVDAQRLRDIALTRRDWVFQLACFEIVEIEVAPVAALGKPDNFLGRGKESPIWPIISTFEIGIHRILDNVANLARGGVGHS